MPRFVFVKTDVPMGSIQGGKDVTYIVAETSATDTPSGTSTRWILAKGVHVLYRATSTEPAPALDRVPVFPTEWKSTSSANKAIFGRRLNVADVVRAANSAGRWLRSDGNGGADRRRKLE